MNMSTFMAKPAELERKWYIIDAANKPLGRVAAAAASILRGKVKPTFTPNVDCGDFVIILNAEKVVLTGKKIDQKYYRYHTGYVGGLKEISYKHLMAEKPEKAIELAVKGMLPHNTIGANALTRLRVYQGTEHNHAAQKPEEYTGLIK
jgi:large subunit ribosomal protein L13